MTRRLEFSLWFMSSASRGYSLSWSCRLPQERGSIAPCRQSGGPRPGGQSRPPYGWRDLRRPPHCFVKPVLSGPRFQAGGDPPVRCCGGIEGLGVNVGAPLATERTRPPDRADKSPFSGPVSGFSARAGPIMGAHVLNTGPHATNDRCATPIRPAFAFFSLPRPCRDRPPRASPSGPAPSTALSSTASRPAPLIGTRPLLRGEPLAGVGRDRNPYRNGPGRDQRGRIGAGSAGRQ